MPVAISHKPAGIAEKTPYMTIECPWCEWKAVLYRAATADEAEDFLHRLAAGHFKECKRLV